MSRSNKKLLTAANNWYWDFYCESLLVFRCKDALNLCWMQNSKLAIFDLDNTIITTNVNRQYVHSVEDWMFLYKEVPEVLH